MLVERLRVAYEAQDLLAKVDKDAAGADVRFADVYLSSGWPCTIGCVAVFQRRWWKWMTREKHSCDCVTN